MKEFSVFDILGPIMIGPSSSHTAGAARLGKVAMEIAGPGFGAVTFGLHGSFAKTYKGHGTDRALVAGVLGMEPDDEKLKDSFNIAKACGLMVDVTEVDLGYEHPNTAVMKFQYPGGNEVNVVGSSIGGGNILITQIDGHEVEISVRYPTLFIKHNDRHGTINRVTSVLAKHKVNIATMSVSRKGRGQEACMVIEMDHQVSEDILREIEELEDIISVRPIKGGGDV